MLLTAATLITGDGVTALKNHAVLLKDGRIEAVGPLADFQCGPDTPLVDYGDATILPGLIDMHTHLGRWMRQPDRDSYDPSAVAFLAQNDARRALLAGVTTLRTVGGPHNVDRQISAAAGKGWFAAPRILSSNSAICPTGGHSGKRDMTVVANGETEIRAAIRQQIVDGAHWIKILTSARADVSEYTLAELTAAVDEAHRHGRKIAVHASRQPALQLSIDAGCDTIEHGCDLTEAQIEQMARKGIAWVPTLHVHRRTCTALEDKLAQNGMAGLTPLERETYAIYHKAHHDFVRNLMPYAALGVDIAAGTDCPGDGSPVAAELRCMVDYGMSPLAAIRTATATCARLLGLADTIGRLAPGLTADLLVVEGDAGVDISALERVQAVYQAGQQVV